MKRSGALLLCALLLGGVGGVVLLARSGVRGADESGALSPRSDGALEAEGGDALGPPPAPRVPAEDDAGEDATATPGREEVATAAGTAPIGALHGRAVIAADVAPNGAASARDATALAEVPAAGVRAVLVPGTEEPAPALVARLFAEAQPGHFQITDADGRFTFVGLRAGEPYSLLLGGDGTIGSQRFWPVQAGQAPRDYRMHHLYGARIHLRDPAGDPPKVNSGLLGQRAGRALSTQPGVFPLFGAASAALLAGVDLAQIDPEPMADRLLLFSFQFAEEQVGPFQFRASYPGYVSTDFPFHARRAALGFSEYQLELVPTAEGFGALDVELIGWRGPCPALSVESTTPAFLRLNSTNGEVIHYELRGLEGDRLRVEGIPWGDYQATFGTSPSLRSTVRGGGVEVPVQIGPVPSRMLVDLSERGSLVLHLIDAAGAPHTGRVSMLLAREDPKTRGWRTHAFNAAPYRIDDLEPGTWNLYLQLPFPAGTSAERPLPVQIAGGTCRELSLTQQ